MEFFKKETHFDFMGMRRWVGAIALLLWFASIGFLVTKGLNFGLDFTGGAQVEARLAAPLDPATIRSALEAKGFHGVRVQQYGSTQDILIRVASYHGKENEEIKTTETQGSINVEEGAINRRVQSALQKLYPDIEIRRTEYVGAEVGEQLFEQGGIAVLVAIFATMIYIAMRFEYRLAVSAAVGLIHDGFILLGIFSFFSFEFDLAALAAVMAVLGYSLNDTIVVFDRVRENFRKVRKGSPAEIMNLSVNQTLSRTIMTSLLTMLVVLALLVFGGESLFSFSIAFFIGIVLCTFSSIYVSGALALWLGLSRSDLLPKPKMVDERP